MVLVPALLVCKQPDLGTALVFGAVLFPMLFWAGCIVLSRVIRGKNTGFGQFMMNVLRNQKKDLVESAVITTIYHGKITNIDQKGGTLPQLVFGQKYTYNGE